jgi:hypothetical protein
MPSHRIVPFLSLVLAGGGTLAAQATADQARLVFSINVGFSPGGAAWTITGQPLFDSQFADPVLIDTVSITRRLSSAPTFGAKGIYFAGDHVGLMGEAQFIGLGFDDSCTRTVATLSSRNASVCGSVDNGETSGSAVLFGGGLVYRVNSRKTVSPYARAGIGLVLSSQSSVRTVGQFLNPNGEPVQVEIFPDETETRLNAAASLALGFTAVVGRGYQIRWEVTDRVVGVRNVAGPSVRDGEAPPTTVRYHHRLGIEIGFDVILERRRGRRY